MKKLLAAAILLTVIVFASSAFPLDPQEVNSFDRPFMAPYSKTLDDLSLVPAIAVALSPAVLLTQPSSEYLTIGLMYIESFAITYGSKELIKYLVHRERPYMYDVNTPMSLVQDEEHNESFLSGHTALAFNGASFASYVFCKYNPDSKWKIPVIAASYSLAAATAAMRVASGCHFVTDVLAGAALGTVIGIAVPALHTLLAKENVTVSASPFGLVFSKSY
ncbi:MAG: phosphatase PAP2 family protein [Spirochaetales bacterium]|nr:phosphatase PAP2 family protein [Spirochaetales bacterium]MBQ3696356.1 phosphatase PAP2 family protein [Spirochaetales bacterium]MBQ9810092.1 phosphatase PAP2 family protein [Spirochaetales bacterium]MBR0521127.1 phosphatase PAP2 family protein [Spirochaetales bacterium]